MARGGQGHADVLAAAPAAGAGPSPPRQGSLGPQPSAPATEPRRDQGGTVGWSHVRRPVDQRMVAGVAGALGDVVGVSALAARVAFVVLSFAGGVGLAAYVVLWLFLPPQGSHEPIVKRAVADRRTVSLVLAVGTAIATLMVAAGVLGAGALLGTVAPGAVALAGLVAIWRHAGPDDKAAALRLAAQLGVTNSAGVPSRRRLVSGALRLLLGVVLVAAASTAFVGRHHLTGADFRALLATLAVLAGFALVLAPWWLRLGRDLG